MTMTHETLGEATLQLSVKIVTSSDGRELYVKDDYQGYDRGAVIKERANQVFPSPTRRRTSS